MDNKTIRLIFTSYKDSIDMDGLKVSMEHNAPKLCSHPTLSYLIMPMTKNLTVANMERICNAVLDNNWELVQDFVTNMHELGIRQIVLCCWCTKEQIAHGKFCTAGIVGNYIQDKVSRDGEFRFPVEIEFRDGREVL